MVQPAERGSSKPLLVAEQVRAARYRGGTPGAGGACLCALDFGGQAPLRRGYGGQAGRAERLRAAGLFRTFGMEELNGEGGRARRAAGPADLVQKIVGGLAHQVCVQSAAGVVEEVLHQRRHSCARAADRW